MALLADGFNQAIWAPSTPALVQWMEGYERWRELNLYFGYGQKNPVIIERCGGSFMLHGLELIAGLLELTAEDVIGVRVFSGNDGILDVNNAAAAAAAEPKVSPSHVLLQDEEEVRLGQLVAMQCWRGELPAGERAAALARARALPADYREALLRYTDAEITERWRCCCTAAAATTARGKSVRLLCDVACTGPTAGQ